MFGSLQRAHGSFIANLAQAKLHDESRLSALIVGSLLPGLFPKSPGLARRPDVKGTTHFYFCGLPTLNTSVHLGVLRFIALQNISQPTLDRIRLNTYLMRENPRTCNTAKTVRRHTFIDLYKQDSLAIQTGSYQHRSVRLHFKIAPIR